MQILRGRWIKDQIELKHNYLATLPKEFEIDLGVDKVPVINLHRFGRLLLDSFHMPVLKEITVTKIGSLVRVGPVLGILARGLNSRTSRHFKKYFEHQTTGLTYVFDESLLTKSQLEGYFFNEDWHYTKLPRPNYVFDRTYPNNPQNRLKLPRSVFFNPITQFSKIEIMKLLKENGIEVPESISGHFEKVFRRFPLFYLKPDRGSFGEGIYIVRKRTDDYVVYSSRDDSASVLKEAELVSFLLGLQDQSYFMQRGIEPIEYEGDPLDFRLHVLADPYPRLVFLAARTSSWDFLYTSSPKKLLKTREILASQDQETLNQIITQLHAVLKDTYGPYVEFSLDVIKEAQTGKFYVIDLNGKSTRTHPEMFGDDLSAYYNASKKLAEYLFIRESKQINNKGGFGNLFHNF